MLKRIYMYCTVCTDWWWHHKWVYVGYLYSFFLF